MNLNAQDALTAEYNCETGCLDLIINGGFAPYEVEWQSYSPGQGYITISGWPKVDLNGNDGNEDLCNIAGGRYKVLVTDALCGTVELRVPAFTCDCHSISLIDKVNVRSCNGVEPDLPGSTATESCDGSIDIEIESNSPYTISWTGPNGFTSSTEDISNLCTGTYKVKVTFQGCIRELTFDICCCNVGLGLPWDPVFPFPLCTEDGYTPPITINGEIDSPNGAIAISIDGGATPSFSWTGPNGYTSTLQNISNLELGIYCLRVFDGCSEDEECFEIVDCNEVNIQIDDKVTKTCEGYCYGSITLSVSGGKSPYQYNWSNGSTNSSISNLCKGEYCITITDKSGCESIKCITLGVKDQDVNGVTNPCGWQYSCNGNPTEFVDRDLSCYYDDPFDCTRVNCYCPVTAGYVFGWNESYTAIDYDWSRCVIWGRCPDGSGWDVAEYGTTQTWYQYIQVCDNCFQCYYIKACFMGGSYAILESYAVGDSKCGGSPGINGNDDDKLSLNSPIRLNELNYLLKRDTIIEESSLLLIPEGLSDTMFLEEYTDKFAVIRENGAERIRVNELPLDSELTEIDCIDKDCKSKNDGIELRSIIDKHTTLIESTVIPNPFMNHLTINIFNHRSEELVIEIKSVLGQTMYYTVLDQNTVQVETSQWHSGVYICVIKENSKIIGTHKILKQ